MTSIEETFEAAHRGHAPEVAPIHGGCPRCIDNRALMLAVLEETLHRAPPISDHQIPALRARIQGLGG